MIPKYNRQNNDRMRPEPPAWKSDDGIDSERVAVDERDSDPPSDGCCGECGAELRPPGYFCTECGAEQRSVHPGQVYRDIPRQARQPNAAQHAFAGGPHHIAARGVAYFLGLHPIVAMVTVAVDLMLHTADVVSAGLLLPLSFCAGFVLGGVTFLAQRAWFREDDQTALIKAFIVALLTAIPSPLPYVLFVPAGVIGYFKKD